MENSNTPARLKKTSDYKHLNKFGRRIYVNSWLSINCLSSNTGLSRIGLTVPKYVGNAVIRNRIKRYAKGKFVLFNDLVKPADINLFFKKADKQFYKKLNSKEVEFGIYSAVEKINKSKNSE